MTADSPPDLTPAIPVFIRRLHADSTCKTYRREVERFLAWLESNAPLDDEILPRYVEHLRARKLSATFIAWRATVIITFLRDCHRQGVLDRDVTLGYVPPRGTRGFAVKVLSADELRRLLRTPDRRSWLGRRDLAALVCMSIGGLRSGEVTRLRICDVEISGSRVNLRVRGKGDRIRLVAFESRNAAPLRSWAKVRGDGAPEELWLLARRPRVGEPVRPMAVSGVDYVVRKNGRAAGLERLHAHLLRHSCASLALAGGANLIQVRDLLGHGSVLTTSRYLHATESDRPTTSYVAIR